jgi:predicted HicB family RNase H-like nuclease
VGNSRIVILARSREEKERIKAAADRAGMSLNAYIIRAIQDKMES